MSDWDHAMLTRLKVLNGGKVVYINISGFISLINTLINI